MNQDPIFGDADSRQAVRPKRVFEFSILGITLFRLNFNPVKPELDPLEVIRKLLEDFEHRESIDKSKSVAALHRVIENTHARRRLEKWSLRVIAVYLVVVLCIVLATYTNIPGVEHKILDIPDNIMITILTTTTANIIGLGLIVLRGHFLSQKEDQANKED